MALTNQIKNQHLMWRAGFGPAVEQLGDLSKYNHKQVYKALIKGSDSKPDYLNAASNYLDGLYKGMQDVGRMQKKELDAEERKKINQENRESIRNLNMLWSYEMVNSAAQLREKMAFFWHGHFACRNLNIYYQQRLLDVLRRNALGNFGTMLKEVSKSAAMLNFLNNQQNKKDHPNENFAREVMELFTLGRGNYTEDDVKQGARAFTGWTANLQGDFVFQKKQHDDGSKTFLGKTGNFDGDDILNIILDQKQAARFITLKIYRYFVNDDVDKDRVEKLADKFYRDGYDIGKLMEEIFTGDWFYQEKNIGTRIKSPIELITGIQRMLPMKFQTDQSLMMLQQALGQTLFYPPNVAGWAGGKTWIDSSTLMLRMRIPQMLDDKDEFNVTPKRDDDILMGMNNNIDNNNKVKAKSQDAKIMKNNRKPLTVHIDWSQYLKNFDPVAKESLLTSIAGSLLQTKNEVNPDLIKQYIDNSSRENFVKTATLQIMSVPEYQLC